MVVAVVVVLAVLLVGVRIFGIQVFTVLSGSMEPEFMTGSLIYVKSVSNTEKLNVRDIITFRVTGNTVATHRIVEVIPSEVEGGLISYRTQGDANDTVDGNLVSPTDIIGVPVFSIPKLGYLANYIQNPPGTYIAIAVCAGVILVVFMLDFIVDELFGEDNKKDDNEKGKKGRVDPLGKRAAPKAETPAELPRPNVKITETKTVGGVRRIKATTSVQAEQREKKIARRIPARNITADQANKAVEKNINNLPEKAGKEKDR